ncbi:FecR family protein [Flavobacterium acetivorans]|uniref:FecR family protein n=1 Tax=Flavobacterium acetivorans TaxID=2893883 RepID=UPI001E2F3070|nr:FecR domain-containing protein [Flavobacterium sp. F-29]UFH34067.1 DUF4974 domain-containing protein [Flavobacterium sp. F-29]
MKQDSSKYHIAQLIYKSVANIITIEEKKQLDNWLIQTQNKALYKKITNKKNIEDKLAIYNQINTDEIYNRLEKQILKEQKKTTIPLFNRTWTRYAVAASILLMVTLTIFVNKEDSQKIPKQIIVENNIKAGTDKAILTLADGSEITLTKGQNYQNQGISSNGEQVVYGKNVKKDSEILYNYLTIPRGGQFSITLSDGTQVWLNSESKLKYPTNFTEGKTREIELVYGEAYFDVSPSTSHKGSKFKVFSGNQNIEVLGTEFNVKGYKDEDVIYTTLIEGKVAIETNKTKKILHPGQQATYSLTKQTTVINPVDLYNETSWKNGVFSFKDLSLKEIMKVLARWYDMEVIFVHPKLENLQFTGVLDKKQSINEILLIINQTNNINYDINNKTIIIR